MNRPIDDKVVKLSLDNESFINKVKQSVQALLGMDKSIEKSAGSSKSLDNVSNSLDKINSSSKRINLETLSNGAEKVKVSFSAMSAIATGALMKIGSEAISAGQRFSNAFTFKPIAEGFNMYQDKLKSIQVILANTQGKSNLDDVTKSLDVLNDYANKTVYSFQDMTTNMGTFTAAGVDLKTSQVAIQGISNLAASSGSSVQQASTAMYQLSQAIASGKVGLQDWNSVVNAGMGGKVFQSALQETAKSMGKNVDASKSFRDSLQDGWVTTDVLMATLQKFANDPSMLEAATKVKTFRDLLDTVDDELRSGWSKTFELLIGNFEQAPVLWTKISNVVTGGIQSSANARNAMIKDFVDLGGRQSLIDGLSNAFRGLGQVMGAIKGAFHDVFPPATGKQLADLAAKFAEFSKHLIMSSETTEKVKTVFKGLFSILDIGIKVIGAIGAVFESMIPSGLVEKVLDLAVKLANVIIGFDKTISSGKKVSLSNELATKTFNKMCDALGDLSGFFDNISDKLVMWKDTITSKALPAIKDFFGFISKNKPNVHLSMNDLLGGVSIGAIALLTKKIMGFSDTLSKSIKGLIDSFKFPKEISSAFGELKNTLVAFQDSIKARNLLEIAAAMLAIAVSLKILEGMKFSDIGKGLITMAVSYTILSKTISAISKLDFTGLSALKAIALIMALSFALINISAALKIMGSLNTSELGTSLVALAGSMAILVVGMKALSTIGHVPVGAGLQIMLISTSLIILGGALKILGSIDMEQLKQGLLTMAALLGEVALYAIIISKIHISVTSAIAMNLIATALTGMAGAVALLGLINIENLVKGLGSIAYLLLTIAGFSMIIKPGPMLAAGVGITALAVGLNLMMPPVLALAFMPLDKLAVGLGALAVVLTEVGLALRFSGSITGAVSIMAMAVAINLLVPPLLTLSLIPMKNIAGALIMLAGAFTIMGVAARLVGIAGSVALLAFAAAIGAIGLALTGVGLALTGFAASLVALSSFTAKSIDSIVKNLGDLLTKSLILIPKMVEFGTKLVLGLIIGITTTIPKLAEAGLKMIVSLLESISKHIGKIIKLGTDVVVKFMDGITKALPRLIEAGARMVLGLVNGIANSIRKNSKKMVDAVGSIIEAILEVVVDGLAKIVTVIFGWIPGVGKATEGIGKKAKEALRGSFNVKEVADEKGDEFTKTVDSKSDKSHEAGKNVGSAAKKGIEDGTNAIPPIGVIKGSEFANGFDSTKDAASNAGTNVAGAAKSPMEQIATNPIGVQKGSEFAGGLNSMQQDASDAGSNVSGAGRDGTLQIDYASNGSQKGSEFAGGINQANPTANINGQNVSKSARSGMDSIMTNPTGSKKGSEFAGGVRGASSESNGAGSFISSTANGGMNKADTHSTGASKGIDFAKGVSSKNGKAKDSGKGLGTNTKKGAEGFSLYNIGKNMGQGFINGIDAMVDGAKKIGAKIAKAAHDAAGAFLQIGSPSRLMRKLGVFTGQGFINGMDDTNYDVEKSAIGIASSAIKPFENLNDKINKALGKAIDYNPIIKPTVDMSKVQDTNWSLNTSANPQFGQNGVFPATNPLTIGDVNIKVDAADALTASQTVDLMKQEFKNGMTDEIRKLRYVY